MSSIIRAIFEKYSPNGRLTSEQFVKLLTKMSKSAYPCLPRNPRLFEILFILIDKKSNGFLSMSDFLIWWNSTNHFSYILGTNSKYLERAYNLYSQYKNRMELLVVKVWKKCL